MNLYFKKLPDYFPKRWKPCVLPPVVRGGACFHSQMLPGSPQPVLLSTAPTGRHSRSSEFPSPISTTESPGELLKSGYWDPARSKSQLVQGAQAVVFSKAPPPQ